MYDCKIILYSTLCDDFCSYIKEIPLESLKLGVQAVDGVFHISFVSHTATANESDVIS